MTPREELIFEIYKRELEDRAVQNIILSESFYQKLLKESCFPERFHREGLIYEKPYIVNGIKHDFELI